MRRATAKKVLLRKQPERAKRRDISPAARPIGTGSLYEEIKRRSGKAHVCIIRSVGGIGDVLMTTPVMRQLKREFPFLRITYAVDQHRVNNNVYGELVKNAWFIDNVIDARYVQRDKYDAVVDVSAVCLRYERKGLPPINRIDLFARACGVTNLRNKVPFYKVEASEEQWARRVLSQYRKAGKTLVVLHTASFEGKRTWHQKNQLAFINLVAQHKPNIHFIVFDYNRMLGGLEKYSNCTNLSNTSVREMASYIAECDFFIGPDSGPMHLAGALGVPALITFGSIPPEARINHYPEHHSIRLPGLSCLGCWYEGCPISVRCMAALTGQAVYDKMIQLLGV